jgi:hypothetical protein
MPDYEILYRESEAKLSNAYAALENEAAARTAAEADLARVSSVLHLHQQAADAITAGASGILNNNTLTADQKLAGLATALAHVTGSLLLTLAGLKTVTLALSLYKPPG